MVEHDAPESLLCPIFLKLDGVSSLVVGAGPVVARKVAGLLACGAQVTVVVPVCSAQLEALGDKVSWQCRAFLERDLERCRLVVAATDDAALNRQVTEGAARYTGERQCGTQQCVYACSSPPGRGHGRVLKQRLCASAVAQTQAAF